MIVIAIVTANSRNKPRSSSTVTGSAPRSARPRWWRDGGGRRTSRSSPSSTANGFALLNARVMSRSASTMRRVDHEADRDGGRHERGYRSPTPGGKPASSADERVMLGMVAPGCLSQETKNKVATTNSRGRWHWKLDIVDQAQDNAGAMGQDGRRGYRAVSPPRLDHQLLDSLDHILMTFAPAGHFSRRDPATLCVVSTATWSYSTGPAAATPIWRHRTGAPFNRRR